MSLLQISVQYIIYGIKSYFSGRLHLKRFLFPLLISLMLTVSAHAADTTVTVDIPAQNVLVGDQYYVTVSMEGNPGFASAQMELFYNADVVRCVKVIPGDVVRGMLSDTNPHAVGEQTSAILSAAGISNTDKNGTLVTFVFDRPQGGDPDFRFALTEMRNVSGSALHCDIRTENRYVDAGVQDPPSSGGTPVTPPGTDIPSGGTPSPDIPQGGIPAVPPASDQISPPWWVLISQTVPSVPPENTDPASETELPAFRDELMRTGIAFSDVGKAHWAKKYVEEAAARGVINGYPDGSFHPDTDMTRAEIATLLWNLSGQPLTSSKSPFDDVCYEDWFYQGVIWGYEKGYLSCDSPVRFSPHDTVNREQAVEILYRYAGSPPAKYIPDSYEDAHTVSDFARPAMHWAVSAGIITGMDETHLVPQGRITRAQISTIIVRYIHYIKAQTP